MQPHYFTFRFKFSIWKTKQCKVTEGLSRLEGLFLLIFEKYQELGNT